MCYKPEVEREFSAGGVCVRRLRGEWVMAAVRPGGKPAGVWALPKGQIDAGEPVESTALREVREETGVEAVSLGKLGDVRYVYSRGGRRIFKVVSFFLMRYRSGRLGETLPEFALEIAEVRWLPLERAPFLLAYGGERGMAAKAAERLRDAGL